MASSTNSTASHDVAPRPRIVVLTAGGDLGRIVANGLARRLGSIVVIEETPETKAQIIRRRIRLRGVVETAGQIAFGLFQRLFERQARARLEKIWNTHDLEPTLDPPIEVHRVPSINSEECRALLRQAMPAAVAVYGTRIIDRATLGCLTVPFINYHAGINPKYRGQHPAYWARACGDDANCGITIHLVDQGVDTGAVLYQAQVAFTREDTISTYQHVQAATALPLFARALEDAIAGRLRPRRVSLPSRLWFPPTLWTYLTTGLRRGVW